jgi:putative acetyltransferase
MVDASQKIEIQSVDLSNPDESRDVAQLVDQLDTYQVSLYPAESTHLDSFAELRKFNAKMLGAYKDSLLVGIGAVKLFGMDYGEIKRMFVRPEWRGKGVAALILSGLEQYLIASGITSARLETGPLQPDALSFYTARGYSTCAAFGTYKEDPFSVFMHKTLHKPGI